VVAFSGSVVQIWRKVKLCAKRDVPHYLFAKHRKLEALEVDGEHVGGVLNAGASLSAHKLVVQGAAVLVVAVEELVSRVVLQRLLQRFAPACRVRRLMLRVHQ
jgi:hypothetical protein